MKENLTAQGMNMREAVGNSRNRRIWISLVESLSPGASSTRCVQYQVRPVHVKHDANASLSKWGKPNKMKKNENSGIFKFC